MDTDKQAIWIDLDNSPHVPLFAPIIKYYRESPVEVILTARDHSQTVELMRLAGIDDLATVIGRHYGKGSLQKVYGLIVRARQLASHIRKMRHARVVVAFSHGSRSMVLAARWLGIPVVTMYDYEFTETRIFNRFSTRVAVPDAIPDGVLDAIGLPAAKRAKYRGIKEELYIRGFCPEVDFRARLLEMHGVDDAAEKVVAVLRPPATTANYHDAKADIVLAAILKCLLSTPEVITVIVPRTTEQAAMMREMAQLRSDAANWIVLDAAVGGLDLVNAADLLISGGGTMNREAALLGIPVYSIFAGRQGALDEQMEREGTITFIREPADVAKIELRQRSDSGEDNPNRLTDRVESFVIEQIDHFLGRD